MAQPPEPPEPPNPPKPPEQPGLSAAGRRASSRGQAPNPMALMGVGLEFGAVVAVLALLGWWLDEKFATSPWLVLTGTVIGIVGGLYNLWMQGKRYF